ncbi:MAG: hypothetical protein H0U74_04825 [Bradymonadaceae bacterium]|nr:hypothetical protein [Lujinxingiaceae bacterium]
MSYRFTVRAASLLLALQLCTAPAFAQQWPADEQGIQGQNGIRYFVVKTNLTTVIGEKRETIRIPCSGDKAAASVNYLYIGCGTRGVLLVSLSDPANPEPLELKATDSSVTDIYLVKDRVWLELEDGTAQPIDVTLGIAQDLALVGSEAPVAAATIGGFDATSVAAPAAQPKAAVLPEIEGKVLDVGPGFVVISLGRNDGITRGMRVELVEMFPVKLASGLDASEERRLDIGSVVGLDETTSQVSLSMNVTVPKSDIIARPTNEWIHRDASFAPRVGDVTITKLTARPFLPLGDRGLGIVMDASIGYRFAYPLAIDIMLSPLALALTSSNNVLSFAANGVVSYDSDYIQIGLGTGFSRVNPAVLSNDQLRGGDPGLSWTVVQYARLGSTDGKHISLQTQFVLLDNWGFEGLTLTGQTDLGILGERSWLLARTGWGLTGHGFVELGLRMLLRGNGSSGSIFLTPLVGYAGLAYDSCTSADPSCDRTRITNGPMIGATMEWRN